MDVGFCAILYAAQLVVELSADRSGLAVLADNIALLVLEVVNLRDRTDNGSCTAGSSLLECSQFLLRYLTALNLHAHVFSQLHEALVGDTRQNAGRLRSNVSVVLDTEEVGSTALVHIFLLLCIEIEPHAYPRS